ncbi:MAG TPA: hypothetical protein VF000_04095 [Agromyces sp.]
MPDPQEQGLGGRAADRLDEFRRARGLDDDDRVAVDEPAEGDERASDDAPAEGDEPASGDDEGAARDDDTEGVHRPD